MFTYIRKQFYAKGIQIGSPWALFFNYAIFCMPKRDIKKIYTKLFRFSKLELDTIEKNLIRFSATKKSNLSEFIIHSAMNYYKNISEIEIEEGRSKELFEIIIQIKEIVFELNKVGNNINQIAKIANSKKGISQIEILNLKNEHLKIEKILNIYLKDKDVVQNLYNKIADTL